MKFLYFGDLHERPTAPVHRMDNFRQSVNQKIQEIQELGRKYNIKAFLQPGDFLDKPKIDPEFLSEVVNRWGFQHIQQDLLALATGQANVQDLADKMKHHIPIIGAIGNHELYGESFKSYPRTSLAFLEKIGFMHFPTKDHPFIFSDESGFTVAITATHYDIHMDDPSRIDDYIIEQKAADYHIHIVHGYLTNKNMGNLFPHTTVDDIANKTQADLTITGHDHVGFPLTEVDGKYFVNPGAVVRLSNDMKEVRRKPKVLLIDINKESGLTVKTIYLKSAAKGEDVLDRSRQAFQKTMSSKLEEIKSLVNKSNVQSGLSITDIISAISKSQQIDDDLKDRAIQAVTDKMKTIQKKQVMTSDYVIEKLVLENFQSHEYSEYHLKNGLNLFIGKSSSGKSAIQRALAWVYENEGRDPRRFIKNGKDYAKVTLYLSNGMIISRLVEKKKSGKNGYEVFNPMDGETTYYNTKSLPLIQEYLGISYLQLDDKRTIPLNFQKQGMSWFFIGDGFTNTDRAKIIGAVYQTHYVDAVIKEMEANTKKLTSSIKEKKKDIEQTEKELAKFDHLPRWEQTIEEVEKRLTILQALQEKVEKAKTIMEERKRLERQIQQDETLIQSLQNLEQAEQQFHALQQRYEKKQKVVQYVQRMQEILQNIEQEQRILQSLRFIEEADHRIKQLEETIQTWKELREKQERLHTLHQEVQTILKDIQATKAIIKSYEQLDEAINRWKLLEQKVNRLREGRNLTTELQEITQRGVQERTIINQVFTENIQLVQRYQELLKKVGTCPVCQSKIDHDTIEHVAETYRLTEKKGRMKHAPSA